ncbi:MULTISPECIES: hypothetical protein [unclassified Paenibacillus]|uniref:hypothetical protein n=1 Tax=unclassified Paenibacillus TaxID=185978 RepID=UPI0013EE0A1B|nr:hypothetical protein [Paenibacillus sp. EKM212P]KAF6581800.1 hypothetical protein G9G54_05800 [Paenibacillus sp. EKM212P]
MSLTDHPNHTSDVTLLRKAHDDLWHSLQHIPSDEALKLLHSFATQVAFYHEKKDKEADCKNYFRTPLPYIAIAVGISLPTAMWLLILFLP